MISIDLNINKDDQKWLDDLPKNFKEGLYKGVAEAMLFAEAEAKKSFGKAGNLKVRTGRLRQSITSDSKEGKGTLSSNLVYSAIHEFGGTIKPKSKSWLRFKVNGNWKSVKQVVIPARPYLMPAIEDNSKYIKKLISDRILGELQ